MHKTKQIKLPATEFEIMKVIWEYQDSVTTSILMEKLGEQKGWKTPSLISFLNRLIEKGFLSTQKNGKERSYFPLVKQEEYLRFETEEFVKRYHSNSLVHLANTLYGDRGIEEEELDELLNWIKSKKE